MSLEKTGISWFRQTFAWSNSWASWQERLVLLLFLAVAGGLGWLTASIGQAYGPTFGVVLSLTLLWLAYLVALSVCSWLGWLKLFGPVLFYDMVRTARRSRYLFIRLLYASLLFSILCVLFFTASEMGFRGNHFDRDRAVREAAIIAETFFSAFMIVQLALVVLLTPAYVAGAIADEKDRKTLEFMLATDLNNQEIVLSKFLSRLANMTLLLLTGLPILSILQFVGGVDAQLMLSGFAATGLTMLGVASIGILLSTLFQKPRDAIGLTYIFIITYLAAATLLKSLALAGAPVMGWSIWFGEGEPTWGQVSNVVNAGNPIAAVIDVGQAIAGAAFRGGVQRDFLDSVLPELLNNYAYFHVGVFLICITWSIARLRAIALKQTPGGSTKKLRWWERYRPPIGELPMFWKELHIEGRMKLNWLAWGVVILLVLVTLGTGLFIVGVFVWTNLFEIHPMRFGELTMAMNVWFRIAGTGVMCLMILIVAVRASTSIAAERERDTFDALVTTPMNAETILGAKLVGSLMSLRMGWLWFGSMAALAILSGGVHPLAIPIVLGMWFVYAAFFTMVGMWFSMACKSSMRATVYTVLMTLLLGGGHWIVIGFCCYFPISVLARGGGPGDNVEVVLKFQTAMTPPATLALYSYSWENLADDFRHEEWAKHVMLFALFGIVLWSAACLVMWFGILLPKFKQIARREELIYE